MIVPFGDIIFYFSPFSTVGFVIALVFTIIVYLTKPEKQLEANKFSGDKLIEVSLEEMKIRRLMAIFCGLATAGAMITYDLFDYTLFLVLIGISNIGIVSAVKRDWVLNAAFNYGLVAIIASLPLFASDSLVLAKAGTLSLLELSKKSYDLIFEKSLFAIGMAGEVGIAPFYAAKAEMFRAPGSPYILMIHLSSLLVIIRTVDILIHLS
ncbi:(NiFe)-hydrogenase-3-type complex Eha, membrane protein EhaH, predicted [Methanocaldococcus infernus ME]|uniref:(NiFe)-hydrogenase-3-type complex Eha, membrane protein EhaH, predicted n=1 Tax=Methanocaldococcus infernus (strain DSM 11812 / JCM 15783 / ME) TaxID=573063 RepID=D5VTP9_METIM|nr:membrane protein [Methanocaldococcus infernus]ADG13952.1 (NiFe)-hydrogenase-3-type complex Eha, membrane protein EhaH, predicted [Methanocaldococcus infernus ME]